MTLLITNKYAEFKLMASPTLATKDITQNYKGSIH
jgi:hypothetical protein